MQPRFTILEDDCLWIGPALQRQPCTDTPSSASGSRALRIAEQAPRSAFEHLDDTLATTSRQPSAAGPTRHSTPNAARYMVNNKRLSNSVLGRHLVGGIVPRGCANSRVDAESTRRLEAFKRQLEALDPDTLLGLPANFDHLDIRTLLAAAGETVNPQVRNRSIEASAHNYIFHLTCSRLPLAQRGRANIEEVIAHLDLISQRPPQDRAKIKCLLDITRSLMANRNLGSSYEVVRRAALQREAFADLPTYR